jgi:hypothetical protein
MKRDLSKDNYHHTRVNTKYNNLATEHDIPINNRFNTNTNKSITNSNNNLLTGICFNNNYLVEKNNNENITTTTHSNNHYKSFSLITQFKSNAHSIKDLQEHNRPNLSANPKQVINKAITKNNNNNIINKIKRNVGESPNNPSIKYNNNNEPNNINLHTYQTNTTYQNNNVTNNNTNNNVNMIKINYLKDNSKSSNNTNNISKKPGNNYTLDFEKYKSQLMNINGKKVNQPSFTSSVSNLIETKYKYLKKDNSTGNNPNIKFK